MLGASQIVERPDLTVWTVLTVFTVSMVIGYRITIERFDTAEAAHVLVALVAWEHATVALTGQSTEASARRRLANDISQPRYLGGCGNRPA